MHTCQKPVEVQKSMPGNKVLHADFKAIPSLKYSNKIVGLNLVGAKVCTYVNISYYKQSAWTCKILIGFVIKDSTFYLVKTITQKEVLFKKQ